MSIRDFMPDSTFSREYAYNLILFFLNKKLVAYIDKVKAYELLVKQKAIIKPEDIPEKRPPKVTIREIMEEITRSLIPSFDMPEDEKDDPERQPLAVVVAALCLDGADGVEGAQHKHHRIPRILAPQTESCCLVHAEEL